MGHQSETVKNQQDTLQGTETVNRVLACKTATTRERSYRDSTQQLCYWCDEEKHSKAKCPNRHVKCNTCYRPGHFARVCRSSTRFREVKTGALEETYLLGVLETTGAQPWTLTADVKGASITFKIDSGAYVTTVPEKVYNSSLVHLNPTTTTRTLRGPNFYRSSAW